MLERSLVYKKKLSQKKAVDSPNMNILSNTKVANLFFEPSTRTRMSFELVEKMLGAQVLNSSFSESSCQKGESFTDTILNMRRLDVDLMVIRHPISGVLDQLDPSLKDGMINAGDGMHAHPTQALTDLFTIFLHRGSFSDLKVTIVGDILHSRVARSYICGLTKLGVEVILLAPWNMIPAQVEKLGVKISNRVEDVLPSVDIVMMLRFQKERQTNILSLRDYAQMYGLKKFQLSLLKEDAVIMHPGPVQMGIELDRETVLEERCLIYQEVSNGLAVRMALLDLIHSAQKKENVFA